MDEVENKTSLMPQEAPAETNAHAEPEQNVAKEVTAQEKQEYAWNEMRRKEKDLKETIRMQSELIEGLKNIQKPQAAPIDEIDSISDEEYIPKGKVKKLATKEAQRIAKDEVERILKEREKLAFKDRLKAQYADFDDVVNPDTLALLEERKPELARAIVASNDPYQIGLQSYEYIKAFGLLKDIPDARRQREVEQKLEKNEKTVQTPQAYDKRPMAQAFRMTDEQKSQLYDEMMQYARMA